jgi:hypothetical protein
VIQPFVKLVKDSGYDIFRGYHSYHSKEEAENHFFWDCKTHKFIIPKGSRYYANREGEYVSERIMLV